MTNAHPTREEDFDLYALGALDGDDKREFESHVASCSACGEKLALAEGRIALLALAAPPAVPSRASRQRLMRRIQESPKTASQAAPQLAKDRAGQTPKEDESSQGLFGRWWTAILAPVGIAFAIATIFLWTENHRLDRQLSTMRSTLDQQQHELAEAREVADLMHSSDTVTIALAPMPGMPKGSAHVMFNAKMGMLMYDGKIDPAPPDKSYQLWIVPMKGDPISAGVFTAVRGEANHWMMKLPEGVVPKVFAVTMEPAGGMPQPTGPKVLVGAV
jgi:anti-sigma-K factor RskA